MSRIRVKVCRVVDLATAIKLELLGVDFIGIHAIWGLSAEAEALYKTLQQQLRETIPVLVTKSKQISTLKNMFLRINPEIVQLHSSWTKEEILHLIKITKVECNSIPKIISVVASDDINQSGLIEELCRASDYLLFDRSYQGGTGLTIEERQLDKVLHIARSANTPFFIAGGLTPENVGQVVRRFKPFGVDVQTGVETNRTKGEKDLKKVSKFINEARKGAFESRKNN